MGWRNPTASLDSDEPCSRYEADNNEDVNATEVVDFDGTSRNTGQFTSICISHTFTCPSPGL